MSTTNTTGEVKLYRISYDASVEGGEAVIKATDVKDTIMKSSDVNVLLKMNGDDWKKALEKRNNMKIVYKVLIEVNEPFLHKIVVIGNGG